MGTIISGKVLNPSQGMGILPSNALSNVANVARKLGKKTARGMDYSKGVKRASKLLKLPGEY